MACCVASEYFIDRGREIGCEKIIRLTQDGQDSMVLSSMGVRVCPSGNLPLRRDGFRSI